MRRATVACYLDLPRTLCESFDSINSTEVSDSGHVIRDLRKFASVRFREFSSEFFRPRFVYRYFVVAKMADEEELEALAELFSDSDSEYEFEDFTDEDFIGTRYQASESTSVLQSGAPNEGSDTDYEDERLRQCAGRLRSHAVARLHVCQRTFQHP